MFNKNISIKFSDITTLKHTFPEASYKSIIKLRNAGAMEDIADCRTLFPEKNMDDTTAIVQSRSFQRWYVKNKKVIKVLLVATPCFALSIYGMHSASFILGLFGNSSLVHAIPSGVSTIPAIPNAIHASNSLLMGGASAGAVMTMAGNVGASVGGSGASFFSGRGVILLHIMMVGFFTLVVSSFLKFTGRGDMIPLVAFIGGAIILYEVIGLFNDIYGAIKTLINM